MAKELEIDGYLFRVDDRNLVICKHESPSEAVFHIRFTPEQAFQLSGLLETLVPEDYGVRSDFRIPVNDVRGLSLRILITEQEVQMQPVSLSLSGLYALYSDPQQATLEPSTILKVKLSFEGMSVELPSVVTRCTSDGLGVTFSPSADGEVKDKLANLVMAIQRQWIANCAR